MATEPTAAPAPLRVLLVEDDAFDAELTREYLRGSWPDCEVVTVDDEPAFVEALRRHDVDLVLSDFALPRFSGSEALTLTRQLRPELPFIFVSGVLGEEHVVEMLKRGATDYVVKVRMERLPLVVERALAEVGERNRRRGTERALRESETLYSRLVESLQDHAVVLLSPERAIRSWNGAAQKIFGYGFAEVEGHDAVLLFGDDEAAGGALQARLAEARRRGQSLDERWLQRRDGSLFYSSGVFTALRDADGALAGFSLIALDVTDKLRAAQALEAAKEDAERANRAKDRFLAVLSHELRTPLTPLLAVAHLLDRRADALPPDLARVVPMIRRNVELEARLIDDLLDLTSIERGKLTLQSAPLDLHATLRNALDMSAADIEAKPLQLVLRLDAAQTATVGDHARLQQVFWNVIRNAVKFTPPGGRIEITTANPVPERFVATVRDSGIGIDAAALPHVFTLFEQASDGISRRYGGLGIGLGIARALLQRHGGTIEAASDGVDRGAVFTLTLPLVAARGAAVTALPPPRAASGAPPCDVLLVEDNADVATATRAMLEAMGHRVQLARSLAEARDALAAGRFDLLLCDLGLPDGTGYDVRACAPALPAIAISGYGMQADLQRSEAAGFAAHIVKPFMPEQLRDAIAALREPAARTPA